MTPQQTLPGVPAPTEPMALTSLSISKVNQYLRCPLSFYYWHVMGLIPPPRSCMVFGRAIHSGIEFNYRKKMESQLDLPLKDIQEFFSADWDYAKGKILWEAGENPGKLKDEGIQLLAVYHAEVSPTIIPAVVEEAFELRFENNVGYTFKGIIDLVDKNTGFIVDHKTTSRAPITANVHKDLQLTGYHLGHRIKYGQAAKGLRFDYLVRGKVPKVVTIETKRNDEDIQSFLKLVGHVAAAIKEQRFYPNPTGTFCSAKLCSYWSECEGGRKW